MSILTMNLLNELYEQGASFCRDLLEIYWSWVKSKVARKFALCKRDGNHFKLLMWKLCDGRSSTTLVKNALLRCAWIYFPLSVLLVFLITRKFSYFQILKSEWKSYFSQSCPMLRNTQNVCRKKKRRTQEQGKT